MSSSGTSPRPTKPTPTNERRCWPVRGEAFDEEDEHLGRAVDGPLLFLDADIRQGWSFDRKRAFALETFAHAGERFGVPGENMKVVFTEHPGESMMGVDRVGGEWDGE